ncbi:UvrD/REP helicase [Tissierellia bacterium KA00581]|nr:UvrD/REP helicase [Tissierellia bacterium KA00581]
MNFTNEQIDAINHFKGPALVLAVPGSGKTTVILNRIINLIENHDVLPKNILSITFSKSQGLDMERRFLKSFPKLKGQITFKTIHAFCYEIVKNYMKIKNIKKTLIEGDERINKSTLLKRYFFSMYEQKILDDVIKDFFSLYDFTKNKMIDFEDYVRKNKFISNRLLLLKLYKAYENLKLEYNFIDFNDLLYLANKYISEDKNLLSSIKKRYKFFSVDEAQDTSMLQFEIIKKIVYPENNLFVVADDDQSIYSFRGAEPKNLLEFKKFYKDSKIFIMNHNFRSTKNIIEISNKLISKNKNRYQKNPICTCSENSKIMLFKVKNAHIQMRKLLELIKQLKKDESVGILYRNNISSIYVANYFLENDVDFFVKENGFDFYLNKILLDINNILQFSQDQTNLEVFKRIYFKLNAYIKKDFISKLKYKSYDENILDALLDLDDLNSFYLKKFNALRNNFKMLKKLSMKYKIDFIVNELGYGEYLENYDEIQKLNSNLMIDILKYISSNLNSYDDFLQRLKDIKEKLKDANKSSSNISISTIHSAKGLEYDHVFLLDLVDGEFPQKNILNAMDSSLLEEERRLFYVAMTRAKKTLTLFTIKTRNEKEVDTSIFYEELKKLK